MKIICKMPLVLITLMTAATALSAQKISDPAAPDISSIADSVLYGRETGLASNKSVVGATIGVYWKGKSYYYSYGMANRERQIKTDTNTLFEIGSNTKVFTGLMLSSEMAAGKMSGNDFIEKYVPVNHKIKGRVRLTDIANHISGLPTFHDSVSLAELIATDTSKDPLMLLTDDYMLEVLKKVDTLHDYGSYEYSNLGVGLLGYILQQHEHASYDELLQRLICKPIGLRHTTADADTSRNTLARGYYRKNRAPFIKLCTSMQGAGAIKSNITDMMAFIRFQILGNRALKHALEIDHKIVYSGENLQVAMGWHISKMYDETVYEMRGDTYGASSLMMFSKEQDLGLVILLNSANSGVVGNIENTILLKLLDKSGNQNRYSQPEIVVDPKILRAYAGTYELQPGFDATVSVLDGKLALQLTGQPSLPFKAVGNNWFVLEKYECQLEFAQNAEGTCNQFFMHQHGEKISCKRK